MTKPKSLPVPDAESVPIENHVFYWLTLAINRRNVSLARALAPLGCKVSQWRVMNMLRQYPGLSVGQLADRTAVDRTTLTRIIDGLEKSGLLVRDVRPENRRIVSLGLSDKGHRFYDTILPVVLALNADATQGMSAPEAGALIDKLKRIVDNLGGIVEVGVGASAEALMETAAMDGLSVAANEKF